MYPCTNHRLTFLLRPAHLSTRDSYYLASATDQIGNEQLAAALDYADYDARLVIGTGWHNKVHGGHVFPDTLRWMFCDQSPPNEFATFLADTATKL